MNSKQKGGIGVAAVIAHLTKKGDLVYIPLTESGCDLIIDRDGQLLRVEVKATWNIKGSACLKTNAGHYTSKGIKKGKFNADRVDLLVVYNGNTGTVKEFDAKDLQGRSTVNVQ